MKSIMSVAPSFVCLLVLAAIHQGMAKNYYVHATTLVNWYVAFEECAAQGQQLATITSEAEEKQIEQAITAAGITTQYTWTSGSDQGHEGQYVWFSTGQPLNYTKWIAGDPNNFQGNENCLVVFVVPGTSGWYDWVCTGLGYYVCEDKICKSNDNNNCNNDKCGCGGSKDGLVKTLLKSVL